MSTGELQDSAFRFVFLLSHERSGSHYLTDLLVSTGELRTLDEVCNFNAINPDTSPASFFGFRRAAQAADPDIALRPSWDVMTRFMDRYLDHLAGLDKTGKRLLIDIKYGHVHNFEIGWWPSERRPFLFNYLERRGIKIVHLSRRDALAAIASGLIADERRIWHCKSEAAQAAQKVRLPAPRVAQDALALEREKENFSAWLAGNACFNLEYEQLSTGDQTRHDLLTKLCAFLGLTPPAKFTSTHRKVTPSLRDALENYEEVLRVARDFGGDRLKIRP